MTRRIVIALVLTIIALVLITSNRTADQWFLRHEAVLTLTLWMCTGIGITLAVHEKRSRGGTLFHRLLILCAVSVAITFIIIITPTGEDWVKQHYNLLMYMIWLVSGVILTLIIAKSTGRAY